MGSASNMLDDQKLNGIQWQYWTYCICVVTLRANLGALNLPFLLQSSSTLVTATVCIWLSRRRLQVSRPVHRM